MKAQKQKMENEEKSQITFRFSVDRIHIKVKFACRLYLEYFINGENRKSPEIRIDQKCNLYKIDEQIIWQSAVRVSSTSNDEQNMAIYVKLLSNKGLAFTAGVITISLKDCLAFGQRFTLKLAKSLDFDAYCECRRLDLITSAEKKNESEYKIDRLKSSEMQIRKKESNVSEREEKIKLTRLSSMKNQNQKESPSKSIINSNISYKNHDRKLSRTQSFEMFITREKELLQKLEDLQSQIHKNIVLSEKQKQIIMLLEAKQRQFNQQKTLFKSQIKALEFDIDNQRQKIRQLEGEKLKLLMNTLHSQKQIATLKQKVGSQMEKTYERIKRLFQDKSQKIFSEFALSEQPKDDFKISLSKITNLKDKKLKINHHFSKYMKGGDQLSKGAFSAVRGLINKQAGQGLLEESLGYRDNSPSSLLSNTLNDMSISDINGKAKEVSLLNSQLFLKPQESEQLSRSPSNTKQFIEEISKSMSKLESMVTSKMQKTIQSFVEILEKNRACVKDGSSAEQSLLGYLQQLESGFERQLGVLGQKERVIAYYQELIQQLNEKLLEKQNMVVQLEEQLFRIQEEKDQIKSQLHDINYVHSLKEEQLMKKIHILEHGRAMPDYSSSASPTNKPQARRKEPKVPNTAYEQEIIEYKQHLRMMEIDLLHERGQRQKLAHSLHEKQLELQEALIEKRRLEFANKIRQRMASLNQSIQLTVEEAPPKHQDKFTQQSRENEQDFLNIFIYQQ